MRTRTSALQSPCGKVELVHRIGIIISGIILVTLAACSREAPKSEAETSSVEQKIQIAPAPSHTQVAIATEVASVAGVEWKVPAGWTLQPPRSMRFATYTIPAAQGDAEGGECAVFYFGTGQGGDVRTNIDRWISQFESSSDPGETSRLVNGVKVTTVTVSGTYLAPGGPMMQSQGKKENYRLLGAIIEAPEGAVFFKSTGPSATMNASKKDFESLVNSIQLAK
jgi:hypothetical protein